jgi:penicillin-binding protein 1A
MASAYAAIANDGVYVPPRFVEKVEDRHGKVLFEGPFKGTRAASVQSARMAVQLMKGVVTGGTGTRARLTGRDVAGKTGTSQNYENAWFVGFTPQLATAVWMGSPEGNVPMTNVRPIGRVTGGSFPAIIWRAYMTKALEGQPVLSFPGPNAKQIPKAKFIKDKYSTEKRVPGSSSTTTVPGSSTTANLPIPILPNNGNPPSTAATTTPTTATPSTTAKPPPTTAKPPDTTP